MITLYPGGAFMFCESVAEFDENLKLPTKPASLTESAGTMEDPVLSLIGRLSSTYETVVSPLYSLSTEMDNTQDAVHKLEVLRHSMSVIADTLRKEIFTAQGFYDMLESPDTTAGSAFAGHLGLYMKNAARVVEEGLSEYTYEYSIVRAFRQMWYFGKLFGLAQVSPEIMDSWISKEVLATCMEDDGTFANIFNGLDDFAKCMLTDHDRRIRLEAHDTETLHFQRLINIIGRDTNEAPCSCRSTACEFNRMISTVLRRTFMESYDLLCMVMDNVLTPEVFQRTYQRLVYRTVNLFSIGCVFLFHYAYTARQQCARLEALDHFDARLRSFLEPKPITVEGD